LVASPPRVTAFLVPDRKRPLRVGRIAERLREAHALYSEWLYYLRAEAQPLRDAMAAVVLRGQALVLAPEYLLRPPPPAERTA
jgi:hypothetical protein